MIPQPLELAVHHPARHVFSCAVSDFVYGQGNLFDSGIPDELGVRGPGHVVERNAVVVQSVQNRMPVGWHTTGTSACWPAINTV